VFICLAKNYSLSLSPSCSALESVGKLLPPEYISIAYIGKFDLPGLPACEESEDNSDDSLSACTAINQKDVELIVVYLSICQPVDMPIC
jgi:hypothetical protein